MATTVVPTSFKVLVKMVASAFYGGMCPPLESMPPEDRERALKPQVGARRGRVPRRGGGVAARRRRMWPRPGSRSPIANAPSPPPPKNDTTGLGRVLLGALTERQWVKEDDLASDLSLHPKMVRRALRYLEQVRGGRGGRGA
jgi:hypothetical protein